LGSCHQDTEGRGQPAGRRRGDEQDHAQAVGAASADPVRECAREQQQRGENQRVPGDHPSQPGQATAQVGPDVQQRDVDHLRVQRHDEEAQPIATISRSRGPPGCWSTWPGSG